MIKTSVAKSVLDEDERIVMSDSLSCVLDRSILERRVRFVEYQKEGLE